MAADARHVPDFARQPLHFKFVIGIADAEVRRYGKRIDLSPQAFQRLPGDVYKRQLKFLLALPCKVTPKFIVGGAVGGIEIFLSCVACDIGYSSLDIGYPTFRRVSL